MTDKELYQQVEQYSEEANALYERIHERVEASIVKHAAAKKKRKKFLTGILSFAVVLVVTLGIVLPITLQPQDQEFRYGDANILIPTELNYSLKEYNIVNNQSLLYLDWYADAEYLFTARYYEEGHESDTVYLYETITDGNSGCKAELSIMKRNIVVESFEVKFEEFETTNLNNFEIVYVVNRDWIFAKFEYRGYKYYLQINYETELDFLLDTIQSMFNN